MIRIINKEMLCNRINYFIEDELKAVIEYEEFLESIPKELDKRYSDIITKIMEDEANHAISFIRMRIELGCPESKLTKELEHLLKVIESETEK